MQLSVLNILHVPDAPFPNVLSFLLQGVALLLAFPSPEPSVSPLLLVLVASFCPLGISPLPTNKV
jgi:hypothetical protein